MIQIATVILVVLSIVFIAALARLTLRRAQALSERIDEYHEAQAAQAQQPGPIDPYANLAVLFGNEMDDPEKRREGNG